MRIIKKYWTDILIGLFFLGVIILFSCVGEDSYLAVHDDLDLFQPQFQMMKDTGTFFTHNVSSPFLHGISRDVMPSEFALGTLFYIIFPAFPAYIMNYIAKVAIGLISGRLLAGEVLGEDKKKYHHLINLCAFAYGAVNFFPCFGIAFASIPLAVYLLLKIERAKGTKSLILWFAALFCYPFVSYFSYLGIFILAYMVVAFIWISIVRKKPDWRMLLAIVVLSAGSVVFEYRLFGTMLFSDEETIRSTMVLSDFSLAEAAREMWDVFVNNTFHADALTGKLVMPICVAYFFISNIFYLVKKKWRAIFTSPFNLTMLIIVFDCVIYGLYTYKPMRNLVETLVPPLTGWQFDRTSFFNPFLWVCGLFMVCKKLYDVYLRNCGRQIITAPDIRAEGVGEEELGASLPNGKKLMGYVSTAISYALVLIYIATLLLTPTRYNDLRATAVNTIKKAYGNTIDDFSYREFYSTDVFEAAKDAIGYNDEWSVAYGLYPAQLEYNGIYTLDGYLGFYSQEYKEEFRKIIAPALERVEASRLYYDNWGARAYLYSGSEESIVKAYKSYEPEDTDLYIDIDAFKALDGKYIFSRFKLTGETAGQLNCLGEYGSDEDAYKVYVYEAK